jgi:hypothetical protein
MQASRGRELQFLLILDLDTRWGVTGQHHFPAALYPHGKDPRYHWIGGWVGLTDSLDIEVRAGVGNLFMLESRINLAVIK